MYDATNEDMLDTAYVAMVYAATATVVDIAPVAMVDDAKAAMIDVEVYFSGFHLYLLPTLRMTQSQSRVNTPRGPSERRDTWGVHRWQRYLKIRSVVYRYLPQQS